MKKQLNEAFDKLKMSDECAEKINNSLQQSRPAPLRIRFAPIVVAASLLLVIFVFTNSTTVQALETVGENIKAAFAELLIPGATIDEQYKTENGGIVIQTIINENGKESQHTAYIHEPTPEFLKVESDGLYFVGNDEHIEIGSLISEDVPFTYIVTHENGLREYISIGGTYGKGDDGLNAIGWAVWHQFPPYDAGSWLGGYASKHYDNKNGSNFPWYDAAKDIMDIPWRG